MRRIRTALAFLVLPSLLALGGCGSGSSGSSATTSTSGPRRAAGPVAMQLTSPAFRDGGTIPTEYTCAGAGKWPDLSWSAPPPGTRELAVLVFDPDAGGGGFVHFLTWDVAPTARGTTGNRYPGGGTPGMNGRGSEGWVPPCPPAGGPHHYAFTVFALSRRPDIASTANVREFLAAIKGTVVASGHLTGLYGS